MNKLYKIKKIVIGMMLLPLAGSLQAQAVRTGISSDTTAALRNTEVEPGRLFDVKKENSTASVSSVSGSTLYKTPVMNLYNTLYGRLAGLTVRQGSGEPGWDDANLNIRGLGTYATGNSASNIAKIFVDGFEANASYLRYLSAEEIESISVLKDAAALSTFGMRGANGIIYITTKRGKIGKPTVKIQARTGLQRAINIDKPLDSYNFARLYNIANSNDKGNTWTPYYTATQLQAYQNGTGTNVDWYDQVLKERTPYTDGDVSFSGGDSTARYFVVFDYANQQGLYNVANSDATSNELMSRYNLRTNLDFNMFKIFEAKVDIGGRIEDRKSPAYSGSTLWSELARYPSNIYPVKDTAGHWSGTSLYPNNPVASVNALGWNSNHWRMLQGNFELKEKLDFVTPGLYLSEAYSFNSYIQSSYNKTANYARYYNGVTTTTDVETPLRATGQSPDYQEDWKQVAATIGYERIFGDHHIISAVNYHQSNFRGDGFNSYAYHYENISGRANYSYKNRYIGEFGFSYFGSDSYAPGHRWGFYPAVSGAWIVSEEPFLRNNPVFSFLKVRASAGKLGGTDSGQGSGSISGFNGRNLYQQYYIDYALSGGTFYTGNGTPTYQTILNPFYIANPDAFAEKSIKYNAGADLTMFKKLDLTADLFLDKRSGILTQDNSLPGSYGINYLISNLGKVTNKGFEVTANFSDKIGKLGYSVFGIASYNKNKIDYMAETPPAFTYNAQTGRPLGTRIGLVATGFYQLSDFNADGSLKQGLAVPAFGTVQPGDLRYKDLDGDNIINENDVTEIGKSIIPNWTYSFGANLKYSGFDFGIFFQGTYGSSVDLYNMTGSQVVAFVNNANAFAIAEGAWSYYPDQGIDTRATATYPRLTTTANNNNYRTSSFWIKSADFLRIRNIELGYSFSARLLKRARLTNMRVFVNAVNPVTWSTLLDNYNMDPETLSGYPPLKSVNAGISVSF